MNKIFEKGGKLYWLHSTVDAFETFLHVPGTVSLKGSHAHDAIDLKRLLILVVIAAAPAALFGMWNVGYQHGLAMGQTGVHILEYFWFGFLKVLPLYIVSYVVGLAIEFASSQIRGEEVSEGYLVSGFFIPLIVPVDIPLWMLAIAVAFAVILGKEVFGGTGMNIWNPALLTRAFLFFSYPNYMSGSDCWIAFKKGETAVADAFTGATPAQSGVQTFTWDFTDQSGQPVPKGTYRFFVEATYNGTSVVTHCGEVSLDAPAADLPVETSYIEKTDDRIDMITDVRARKL